LNKNFQSYLYAICAVSIWGTTFAFSKFFIPEYLNFYTFSMIRLILGTSTLFSYLIISRQLRKWLIIFKKKIKLITLTGILFLGGSYILQYLGITYTTAINQSIISNTQTFWLIFFSFLIFKRKPDKKFIPGAVFAFFGVMLIILNNEFKISSETILGDIISIFAFISWGLYSLLAKELNADESKETSIYITSSLLLLATISIFPVSIYFGLIDHITKLPLNLWPLMIYLGVIAIGLTFLLWNLALSNKNINPENIVIITMLNPVIGIITSIILLGEQFTLKVFFGSILVLSSVFFVNYDFRKSKKR